MFVFVLTYQKPFSEVEKYLGMHRTYLDVNYKAGYFIVSGRQEPRMGGIILCRAATKELALDIMKAARSIFIKSRHTTSSNLFQPNMLMALKGLSN